MEMTFGMLYLLLLTMVVSPILTGRSYHVSVMNNIIGK